MKLWVRISSRSLGARIRREVVPVRNSGSARIGGAGKEQSLGGKLEMLLKNAHFMRKIVWIRRERRGTDQWWCYAKEKDAKERSIGLVQPCPRDRTRNHVK